jgi:hypothetical protein
MPAWKNHPSFWLSREAGRRCTFGVATFTFSVFGISGFMGTAPLRGVEISALTDGLLEDRLATQTGDALVLSIHQFMVTTNIHDLIENVVGEGPRSISSYVKMPVIRLWPPNLLIIVFEDSPPPKAANLLYGLLSAFRGRLDSGEFVLTDIEDAWIDKIVWLYL